MAFRAACKLALIVALLIVCAARVLASAPIQIQAYSCFNNLTPNGPVPIRITLLNYGPAISGVVHIEPRLQVLPDRIYSYDVSVPRRGAASFICAPEVSQYQDVDIEFDSRSLGMPIRDRNPVQLGPYRGVQGTWIHAGLIADDIRFYSGAANDTGYLDYGDTSSTSFTYSIDDCAAEDAPSEASQYDSLTELILGRGSERLSTAQWSAIKSWVVGGGSLVLTGGPASLGYLKADFLQDLLPLSNLHVSSAPNLNLVSQHVVLTARNVAMLAGSARPGAALTMLQAGCPAVSRIAYGAGMVTLIGFDPDQAALPQTSVVAFLRAIMASSVTAIDPANQQQWTKDWAVDSGGFFRSAIPSSNGGANPFLTQLPPASEIAAVLGLYFLLVVPVTYFVLRKMRRLELAWVTTPVLSVLFVYAIFPVTASLYKASMSQRTAGILDVAAGDPDARFLGCTDLFFPSSGDYQIAAPYADSMEDHLYQADFADYYTGPFGTQSNPLETYDLPEGIVAPEYGVTNLAFRRLYYAQSISLGGAITANLRESQITVASGKVTNSTTHRLSDVYLLNPASGQELQIGSIEPGQTKSISLTATARPPDSFSSTLLNDISSTIGEKSFGGTPKAIWLLADTPAAGFGLQMGKSTVAAPTVGVIVSLPIGDTAGGTQ